MRGSVLHGDGLVEHAVVQSFSVGAECARSMLLDWRLRQCFMYRRRRMVLEFEGKLSDVSGQFLYTHIVAVNGKYEEKEVLHRWVRGGEVSLMQANSTFEKASRVNIYMP